MGNLEWFVVEFGFHIQFFTASRVVQQSRNSLWSKTLCLAVEPAVTEPESCKAVTAYAQLSTLKVQFQNYGQV